MSINPSMQLSKNFFLFEFIRSHKADEWGIDNTPTHEAVLNLTALAENVLQTVRDRVNRAISISSGYRNNRVNALANGSPFSDHRLGCSADIECYGLSNMYLAEVISEVVPVFDQLILEFPRRDVPSAGWVHVSYRRNRKNRRQILTAYVNPKWKDDKSQKRTLYTEGLTYDTPVGIV